MQQEDMDSELELSLNDENLSLLTGSPNETSCVFNILLLGDEGVGKTTLLKMYIANSRAPGVPLAPGVQLFSHYLDENGYQIKVHLWDSKSFHSFDFINLIHLLLVDAVILLYDATNVKTFSPIKTYYNRIKTYLKPNALAFIVGTKCDECDIGTCFEIQTFAKSVGVPVFSTSALFLFGVNEVFSAVIDDIRRQRGLMNRLIIQQEELEPELELLHNADTFALLTGSPNETVFNILLLGNQGVGKTTLLKMYIAKPLARGVSLEPGIQLFSHYLDGDENKIKVHLWDSESFDSFDVINPLHLLLIDAVILLYDTTNMKTFKTLKSCYNRVMAYLKPNAFSFIVGTKCDEGYSKSSFEVHKFAQSVGVQVFPTSALHHFGIDEVLVEVIDAIKQQKGLA